MAVRYRRTATVTTRAKLWRSFRALGVVAVCVGAALLLGVLLWNLQHAV